MAISYLGLSPTLAEQEYHYSVSELEYSPYFTHPIDFSSRIKQTLAIVEYTSFTDGLSDRGEVDVQCSICLGELEEGDEVRELGNCSHVFHKCCIDKWVDKGKITCPLCRAGLLLNCSEDEGISVRDAKDDVAGVYM